MSLYFVIFLFFYTHHFNLVAFSFILFLHHSVLFVSVSISLSVCLFLSIRVSVCSVSVYLCTSVSLNAPVCLHVTLCVSLSLPVYLRTSVYPRLSFCRCLSLSLSVCFSLHASLSVCSCLSFYLCLPVSIYVCLSLHVSVYSCRHVCPSLGVSSILYSRPLKLIVWLSVNPCSWQSTMDNGRLDACCIGEVCGRRVTRIYGWCICVDCYHMAWVWRVYLLHGGDIYRVHYSSAIYWNCGPLLRIAGWLLESKGFSIIYMREYPIIFRDVETLGISWGFWAHFVHLGAFMTGTESFLGVVGLNTETP